MRGFFIPRLLLLLLAALLGSGGVSVQAQTADFTSTITQECAPFSVNFTDISSGGVVVNRNWNLGNGTIIPNGAAVVGANYLTAGTYPVTLTVTFSNGDSRTVTKNIIAHPKPVANFSASDTAGCRPHTVSFTDLSTTATGTITNWQWDFGAGGSTVANPTFTYNTNGFYNISLIVRNSWNCVSDAATRFQYIRVYNPPVASFTANPLFGCKDSLTVRFTNTTTGGSPGNTYLWDFGDGSTSTASNPTHFYAAPGTYTVRLTASVGNNCSRSVTRTVTVSNFTAQFSVAPDTACINAATLFSGTASLPGSSIRWIFSDNGAVQFGATTSHVFANTGDFLVTMIATSPQGCIDTIVRPVHVKSGGNLLPFFINAPDTVCLNAPNVFSGSSTPLPASIRWIFSDNGAIQNGSPTTHSFGVLGDYMVTMIAYTAQGCTDTIRKMVHVKNRANLSPFFITAPDTVCVNAATVFAGGAALPPSLIRWQFSNTGAIQTGSPTTYSFAPPGNYQVSLYVSDAQGCVDTLTRPIVVRPGPVPSFLPDRTNGCGIPFTVNFANTTAAPHLQFTWNFGDGSPVVVTNGPSPVSHPYNSFGNFTVTLTARDTLLNCPGPSVTVQIRNIRPNVDFTYVPPGGCMPLPVAFTAQISNLIVPITQYVWNFGDGSTLTTTSPTAAHLYTTAGVFNASLTIVTAECSYTTITKPVTVIQICDDDGSGGGGGGGGGGAGFTVGKTCADKYTVTLTDTVRNTVVISWDFGDGSPVYTTPPLNPVTHTYAPPQKEYVVTVIRQDTLTGLFDTAQKRVIIIDERANFAPNLTEICINGTVLFNTIGIDSSKIRTYTWDFGDGTPRQVINNLAYFNTFGLYLNGNTSHVYADTGLFYVKLIIADRLGCLDSIQYPLPIRVNSPAAAFGAAVQISCLTPIRVTITDSSRPNGSIPITNWQWNFGDGSPVYNSTSDTAINRFYNPGTYTIRLTLTDAQGCVATTTRTIRVALDTAGPRAGIRLTVQQNCLVPVRVVLQDSSRLNAGIPITNWQWDFGNGSPLYNSTVDTPMVRFYNPGTYTVRLTVTDAAGCVNTTTRTLAIPVDTSGPRARFVANPLTTCSSPQNVLFTDTSQRAVGNVPIVEWRWNFGDGSPVLVNTVDTPVAHIYTGNVPGSFYTVTLNIRDSLGCVASVSKPSYIRVYRPRANFFSNDTLKCGSYNASFFNTSSAVNATYTWHFGDGATATTFNASHTYATEGNYNVKLVVRDENGCLDSIVRPSYIKLVRPVADFNIGDTSRCAPTSIIFTDNSQFASSWVWNFGDGGTGSTDQNPAPKIYPLPGFYRVSLSVTGLNGCVDSTFKWIRVRGPIATLQTPPAAGCKPLTFTGRAQGSFISTYAWDFGDGTPVNASLSDSVVSHIYSRGGKYLPNVVLISPEGCPLTLRASDSVIVDTAKALFTPLSNTFCGTGTVSFTSLSRTTQFSSFTNYLWNFGDGTTSTLPTPPPHVFGPGNYTVSLAVTTQYGCVDTFRQPLAVVVNSLPVPRIVGDSIRCAPGSYRYTSSIQSVDSIQRYDWYVNGVAVSNNSNLDYTFVAGHYTIQLIVQTSNGCVDSTSRRIIVDSVDAAFNVVDAVRCANNLSVQFNNTSGSQFGINSYLWNFGDGTTSTLQSPPPHVYPGYGNYSVSLVATSVHGCADTVLVDSAVVLRPLPLPRILGDSIRCAPGSHAYTSSVSSIDPIQRYTWYVDGVQVSSDSNLLHPFVAGNHVIKLVVETVNGCVDSTSRDIIVDFVKAFYTVLNPVNCSNNLSVQIVNGSGGQFGIGSYLWDFGDGTTSTLQNPPPHVYPGAGVYTVSLWVTSVHGCRDSLIGPAVTIHPQPSVGILGDSIRCAPGSHAYTSSVSSIDPIQRYAWYVDGVQVSSDSNLLHPFVAGNHVIKLVVETVNGCVDSTSRNIIVDFVKAFYTVLNPVNCSNNLSVQIVNGSGGQFGIGSYLWDFGDGTTSTLQNPPPHVYPGAGVYTVSLWVTSVHGCRDSLIGPAVTIHPQPSVGISGDSIRCAPGSHAYTSSVSSIDPIQRYAWYVDGVQVSSDSNLLHPFVAGNHVIKLVVRTVNGCVDSVSRSIIVDSVDAAFNVVDAVRCANNLSVQFNNTSGSQFGINSYLWNFGDGTTSTLQSPPPHVYPGYGNYSVSLVATSVHGCADTVLVDSAVVLRPLPLPRILGDSIRCAPGSHAYTSSVSSIDPIQRYAWYVDGVQVSSDSNLLHPFVAGNHVIKLVVETVNGCVDSVSRSIIVDSVDAAFNVVDPVRCANNLSVQFNNTSGSQFGIGSYLWDFGDGTTSTLQNPPPRTYPPVFGVYNVSLWVVSVHGCRDSVRIDSAVVINRQPIINIGGDSIHCRPGTYQYLSISNSLDGVIAWEWKVNGVAAGSSANLTRYFAPGNYRIDIKVTTDQGCVDSATRFIIVDSVRAAFSVNRPIRCGNNDLTVNFNNQSTGQFNITNYFWNLGDGQATTFANPIHTYPTTGSYNVSLIAFSEHGCSDTARLAPAVIIYPTPSVTISGDTAICAGNSLSFASTVVSQDSVTGYQWQINGLPVGNGPALTHLFNTAGNYSVIVSIATANGCTVSDTHHVVVHRLPIPNAGPNTSICIGGSLVLRAYDGVSYEWTPTATLQNPFTDQPLASPQQTTQYKVKVTNSFGCVQYDSIRIQVDNRINLRMGPDQVICRGRESAIISASGSATQFTWSPTLGLNNPNSASTQANPTVTTQYTVTATSGNVCPAETGVVNVTVGDIPTVNLGPDLTVPAGTTITLQPVTTGGVVDYSWSPFQGLSCLRCQQPNFRASTDVTYRVEVRTQYGCTAMDEIVIRVTCNKGSVFIPNTFTPNEDNRNDVFYVAGYGRVQIVEFSVYNRWGERVHYAKDKMVGDRSMGWNGWFRGQPAPAGAYVYVAQIKCSDSDSPEYLRGSVLLIR